MNPKFKHVADVVEVELTPLQAAVYHHLRSKRAIPQNALSRTLKNALGDDLVQVDDLKPGSESLRVSCLRSAQKRLEKTMIVYFNDLVVAAGDPDNTLEDEKECRSLARLPANERAAAENFVARMNAKRGPYLDQWADAMIYCREIAQMGWAKCAHELSAAGCLSMTDRRWRECNFSYFYKRYVEPRATDQTLERVRAKYPEGIVAHHALERTS